MQIDAAAVHPLPAAERVMAEHEVHAVELQFGIARDARPTRGLRLGVVVAEDQVLLAVELRQERRGLGGGAGEIAEMPDLVVPADYRIPALDHTLIHRGDRREGARIQVQDPMVAEMRVADEKDGHLQSGLQGPGLCGAGRGISYNM